MSGALAELRALLGHQPDDRRLIALLDSCGGSVAAAANAFFDDIDAHRGQDQGGHRHVNEPQQEQEGQRAKPQKLTSAWGRAAPSSAPAPKQRRLLEPTPSQPAGGAAPASIPVAPAPSTATATAEAAPSSAGRPARRPEMGKPLAERMRPSRIEELLGQDEALSETIRQAMEADRLPSLILWGPPGCGKTSFAACVASSTRRVFRMLSAARVGVAELREELSRAANTKRLCGQSTILFVDELHRWSKAQQDALLHDSEKGTITLMGATTENPSFSLNNAILSRCRLVVFSKLSPAAVTAVVERALRTDPQLAALRLAEEAKAALAAAADGDARVALNILELLEAGRKTGAADGELGADAVRAAAQRRSLYDRNGDMHYDLISALHKSMRGGSADGALYYACRMLHGGEEPRYITRRLIRFASEDVGLADPQALCQAVAADQAVHAIGMPEAGVCIAQAVVYLALAPKSCAVYSAYEAAMRACADEPHAPVPMHIRNAPTRMMKQLGYGAGYTYNPADGYKRGCEQGYLPPELGPSRTFLQADDCEPGHQLAFCPASSAQGENQ